MLTNTSESDIETLYRTRLISDVVTSKIDVRGAAVPEYEMGNEIIDEITADEGIPMQQV